MNHQPQEQLDLALARRTDPETSHDAAARVDAATLAGRVLASLIADGPATSHELAARLHVSLVAVSPRMRPLVRSRLVEETDLRRIGRIVWRAVKP